MSQTHISNDDLHSYVDNNLTPERRLEVETYLSQNPDAFERVQAYLGQKQAIRVLFSSALTNEVPNRLIQAARSGATIKTSPKESSSWLPTWSIQRIAASFFLAIGCGTIGWMAGRGLPASQDNAVVAKLEPPASYAPTPIATQGFAHQAAIAHVVYSPDIKRPVEVGAEHEDQLVTWLSKRMDADVRPPKLSSLGFELIGGRLLPGSNGPVAQFMYHDITGQRLTLYVSTENKTNKDTAFRFAQEGPVNVFYWVDGKFGYAISAGIEKADLARIATSVFEQIAKKG